MRRNVMRVGNRLLRGLAALFACLLAGGARAGADPVLYAGQFPATTAALVGATLNVGGAAREALVYRAASAGANAPVLVFYSGTGGTLVYNTADELGRAWLQEFAEAQGVHLVFPIPQAQAWGDWDNHSAGQPYWRTAESEAPDAAVSSDPERNPDLLFTRAVIEESRVRWNADAQRVYAAGFSNGAMFAYFAAATLPERIAAFAETGGGLIRSRSTVGDPPCVPPLTSGAAGKVRTCAESGWISGTCRSSGAIDRPIAVAASGRVVPGFLWAHDDDTAVPYAHTCNLAEALGARTTVVASIVHQAGGHYPSQEFFEAAWAFLRAHRLPPESGWWWNPAESGRGFSLEVSGNAAFLAAFLYDASGRASWLAAAGALRPDGGFAAPLTAWRDGQTLTGAYRAPQAADSPGAVDLRCSQADRCTLTWPGGTLPIERYRWNAGSPAVNAPATGWWWNQAESGRGFFLEAQGSALFATAYLYDEAGAPLWLLTTGTLGSGTASDPVFAGQWIRMGSGQTLTGAYRPPLVLDDRVGALRLDLASPTRGTLTLPDGRVLPIERYRF